MPNTHISTRGTETDWEHAIIHAAEPLLHDGSIEQCYINNIIQNVKNHGAYFVLVDEFALAHAEAGVGVHRLGLSYLQLSNVVDMKGKPVSMILILACMDKHSHLDVLAQLVDIIADPAKLRTMKNGSKKEIIALFR